MSTATIRVESNIAASRWPLAGAGNVTRRLNACATALRDRVKHWKREAAGQTPAANWLMDNCAFLLHQIRETQRSLPSSYLRQLPKVGEGAAAELRVYATAVELLSDPDALADASSLAAFSTFLQSREPLTLGELWALSSMLRLVLYERLRDNLDSERTLSSVIQALKTLETSDWRTFVEDNSVLERVLRRDPARVYARMDFETRDRYRRRVEGLARRGKLSETHVAERAIALAAQAETGNRESHVGYYLTGPGSAAFACLIGGKPSPRGRLESAIRNFPNAFYFSMIAMVTAAVTAMFAKIEGDFTWWIAALVLIPASQAALEIVNAALSRFLPPGVLPSMDYSDGIPDDARTLVVVPTLLLSESNARRLLEDLEIRYLANREQNLFFALLTDFPDAVHEHSPNDHALAVCVDGLKRLNVRYGEKSAGPFYLFHRPRRWNAAESTWMGHERKRGKLNDLNRLLLGRGNAFDTIIGDTAQLTAIRYVITLDTDTQLPRDTAAKMIAAADHPLNRPVVDSETGMVREGFSVIRPRVAVSMESTGRSRLAQIISGQAGFDPYATSVSDIYQDLYGQASFTGKGIYDVEAFDRAVGDRFPDNAILSHDLIEGEYAHTGLHSGLELVEDCPSKFEGFMKRKHRWVRGDWQLLAWLAPRVPGPAGKWSANPLPWLSRWKIFDNLRRSLFDVCLLVLFFAGWIAGANMSYWTAAIVALMAAPVAVELALTIVRTPERRFWRAFAQHFGERALERGRDVLLAIIFLPHQALVNADAIVRTLVRRFVTHSNLLEWETMAQSEGSSTRLGLMNGYLYASSAAAFLLLMFSPDALCGVMCALWMAAPATAAWLNQPLPTPSGLSHDDRAFLRGVALKTWRFFADHAEPEQHWLVPDNIQEDPPLAAHRISPTNLGLQLTSQLAALDFGYLTHSELVARLRRIFESIEKMPRHYGHLFNWYDTRTLAAEAPRFVSTVDSGNLATSLCVVRQSCRALLDQAAFSPALLDGLRDHVLRLREELPYVARSGSLMRPMASLLRQLESHPSDLFHFEAVLTDAQDILARAGEPLLRAHQRLRAQGELERSSELQYWQSLLAERMQSVLEEMYRLAPWLEPSIEAELRLNNRDPRLAALFEDLCGTPALKNLPAAYQRIRLEVIDILNTGQALYPALRGALEELLRRLPFARGYSLGLIQGLEGIGEQASSLFEGMDFRFLFDPERKLLRIGYNADDNQAEQSYYDLLASEARTAVFLAIAKGDIPRESWFRLGRKLTAYRNRRTLISWSGTMFEYLMPLLHMRNYENTLLDRGMCGAVAIQQLYANERNLPWGISEAAYSARDEHMQYQYRAFGIPALAADSRRTGRLVVAPYASMLALMIDPAAATANLRLLADRACLSRFGFYESIDYPNIGSDPQLIRCFMTHHQGMGLLAIDNVLLDEPMRKRLHLDPLVQATEFLLQERMPALVETLGESEDAAA